MLREKRISKPPVKYPEIYPEPKKLSANGSAKRRNRKKCDFKMIPNPQKFVNKFRVFELYGDIFIMEKNNTLCFEVSALLKAKVFRNIEVTQKAATRSIKITADSKDYNQNIEWKDTVKRLETSSSLDLKKGAALISDFSNRYENFIRVKSTYKLIDLNLKNMQERNYKFTKSQEEEETYRQITLNTESKSAQLLEFFPCICIKLRFEESNVRINEITFNELLVRDLGYSIDSFITLVFQEGIPQFASHDSEAILDLTKILLENYFTIGPEGIVSPESDLVLFMKSNYLRNARAQTHFLMNYEAGNFGMDILMTVLAKGEPYMDNELCSKKVVHSNFIEEMATKEQKLADFLSAYYDEMITLRYNKFEKVCSIRELSDNEAI